jgi:hypothetical protein
MMSGRAEFPAPIGELERSLISERIRNGMKKQGAEKPVFTILGAVAVWKERQAPMKNLRWNEAVLTRRE